MAQRNEIEAMNVICNIQAMQKAIWGDAARYDQYKNNTVDELRAIQEELLKSYNEKLTDNMKKELIYNGVNVTTAANGSIFCSPNYNTMKLYPRYFESLQIAYNHYKPYFK